MKNILSILISLGLLSCVNLSAQERGSALVIINSHNPEPVSVEILAPIDGFANEELITFEDREMLDNRLFEIELKHPSLFQVRINGRRFTVVADFNDTIQFNVYDDKRVLLSGSNAAGHNYYNTKFFYKKLKAFDSLEILFENKDDSKPETLTEGLSKICKSEFTWVDSMAQLNQVSNTFSNLIGVRIKSGFYWKFIDLIMKYYDSESILNTAYLNYFINFISNEINVTDRANWPSVFWGYYDRYCSLLQNVKGLPQSKYDYIQNEYNYYEYLPNELKPLLYRIAIKFEYEFSPYKYDYCGIYHRYISDFPHSSFSNNWKNNFCEKREKPQYEILSCNNESVFQCTSSFTGSRVLIDIWATWCAPCKAEFKYYDSLMYSFAKEHGVKLLFLSIDDAAHADKWRKEVEASGLEGHHLLADATLLASLKEVIFGDGVVSIPRYILINEKGYFVSTDFVRPSDPDFKKKLIKAFSKP